MKYIGDLFEHFCGYPATPEELEAQRRALSEQLLEPQRKLLLRYADDMIDHMETTALESFAAGYSLAVEIGKELEIWKTKRTE